MNNIDSLSYDEWYAHNTSQPLSPIFFNLLYLYITQVK